ncbi:MAG: methyltransferase domain-containing protein [Gemmatimonadetes bacterium]|nr:methyltransferase domain-containing protein [Gemmatimonadota bacterium]
MGEAFPEGVDPVITDYYDRAPEEVRLEQGPFQLEEARTRELIQRFAPPPPGTVLDVGGAAGAYALWLAEAGYSVHLIDPVPRLVAEAREAQRDGVVDRARSKPSTGVSPARPSRRGG